MAQEQAKVPHTPTKAEEAQAARGYAYIPTFDTVLTPHLRLTIEGNEAAFWRSFWTDEQGTPLEASLAQILQELELRHERAEQQRRDAEREREERKLRWAAARAVAVEQLIQSHRAEELQEQAEDWESAIRLRAYVAAMEARLEACADPHERREAKEWIGWARDYAKRIDPLNGIPKMPADPQPTAEALAPFMEGWDPYGPYELGLGRHVTPDASRSRGVARRADVLAWARGDTKGRCTHEEVCR